MTIRLPGLSLQLPVGQTFLSAKASALKNRRLPITSGGAEALIAALLSDDRPSRRAQLAELLSREPPFLLWCVLRAERWHSAPPAAVAEVATWLEESGPAILQGSTAESCGFTQQIEWARLFGETLATAGACDNEPNRLLALLSNWQQWLVLSGDGSPVKDQGVQVALPGWLAELSTKSECRLDLRSDQWRGNEAMQDGPEVHPSTESQAESRWNNSPAAAVLPRLIEKLARLKSLESDFTTALEREKLAALKELAYGASHEINNPLANISTRAQALLRDETDLERRRKLATINSQAFRAHEMISDLMLFAKPPRLVRKSVEVEKLVDEVLAEMSAEAREQGTLVSRLPAANIPPVSADPDQLAVAVKALVRNSLEAIGCGGRIEVSIRATQTPGNGSGKSIEIVVTDTGPGISPEVRRHLFDPFYSGREAGRGLGFGLAKCWRIVTDHGGAISVVSEPGRGATFALRLPVFHYEANQA